MASNRERFRNTMTRSEKKTFLALVYAICDVMTTGGHGVCTRTERGKSACNVLNCKPYAIAMAQREKLLAGSPNPTPAEDK